MAVSGIIDSLRRFLTGNLDGEWILNAWVGDHSEAVMLPGDFEDLHERTEWLSVLQDACSSVHEYVLSTAANGSSHILAGKPSDCRKSLDRTSDEAGEEEEDAEERQFWSDLVGNGISYKAIILIASGFVKRGTRKSATFTERELGIKAASLYLNLICLPGANAFEVFSSTLYQAAVDVIRIIRQIQVGSTAAKLPTKGGRGRKNSNVDGSVTSSLASRPSNNKRKRVATPHGGGKRSKAPTLSQLQRDLLSDDDEAGPNLEEGETEEPDPEDEVHVLTPQDVAVLVDHLQDVITDIAFVFRHFPLAATCDVSLDHTVGRLCELLAPPWEQSRLSMGAKATLSVVCQLDDTGNCLYLILKHSLDAILTGASRTLVVFLCRLAMHETPNGGANGVLLLLQHICARVPDRADARTRMATVLMVLLESLPATHYAGLVQWLLRYGTSTRINNRLFCLEVFGLLLGRPPVLPDDVPDEALVYVTSGCLLKAVLGRCSDRASTVRAKALAIVAASITSREPSLRNAIVHMFTPASSAAGKARRRPPLELTPQSERPTTNGSTVAETSVAERDENGNVPAAVEDSWAEHELPSYDCTLDLVRRRARDSKVHVRKSASLVLQCALELDAESLLDVGNVEVLEGHCHDPSLLVRKQALQGLTSVLLVYPTSDCLRLAWMHGVLPTIMDAESTCQDKCIEVIEEVILDNLLPHGKQAGPLQAMVWKMLNFCLSEEGYDTWRYLLHGLIFMSRANKIRPNVIPTLLSHLETENDAAAWLILSGLSCCCPIKRPQFACRYWDEHEQEMESKAGTFEFVLRVMSNSALSFGPEELVAYIEKLKEVLVDFRCPALLIPYLVEALSNMFDAASLKEKNARRWKIGMCESVMSKCEKFLSTIFLSRRSRNNQVDEELIIRHLFTVSEISLVRPKSVTNKLFLVMKSLIATPTSGSQSSNFGSQSSNVEPHPTFTKRVRHHGLIAIGKLCLQHDTFAKQCLPAFGRELETTDDFAAKTNIVTIMSDMCKRYTTLVDPYFPSIVACLKDPSVMLRRTTLTLLTNLLQEDYIKWRGTLFYAFLASLIDNTDELKQQTECSLLYVLAVRHPTMFFQHFMECLFYFNAYEDHETYNNISAARTGEGDMGPLERSNLAGEANKEKRMYLYRFMLENMNDDHRFQLTVKLCQDVLSGVVEQHIKLTDKKGRPCAAAHSLVGDALAVLSCEQIKLSSLRGAAGSGTSPEELADEGDLAAAVVATAKKSILTQVVKKNFTESVVPVVIALKHKLEQSLSPLVHGLMLYLLEVVKDYKNEVKEVLAGDKQLAAEVEYDLKRFEKEQGERKPSTNAGTHPTAQAAAAAIPPPLASEPAALPGSEAARLSSSPTANKENTAADAVATPLHRANDGGGDDVLRHVCSVVLQRVGPASTPAASATNFPEGVPRFRRSSRRNPADGKSSGPDSKDTLAEDGRGPSTAVPAKVPIVPPSPAARLADVSALLTEVPTTPCDVGAAKSNPRTRRDLLRAISTPHGVITDITFRGNAVGEQDLSAVSPILCPEVATTLGRRPPLPSALSASRPQLVLHVSDPRSADIVHRKWGIRPPSKRRRSISPASVPLDANS